MDLGLPGKHALVTGSTAGIGFAIAKGLAAEGASVVVTGRTQANVDAALQRIREAVADARVTGIAADCATAAGATAVFDRVPALDILVNNLGIYEAVGFFEETDADWQRLFEVNIMSGVRLSRHYLRGMLRRGHGRIVFISSESGVTPAPEMAHYSATKTMQLSIARSLAELTKNTNVTVNSVLPGPTRTPGVEEFIGGIFPGVPMADAERKFIAANRPSSLIGRLIDPKEIGDTVAFICSDRASAINGSSIRAEGGLVRSIV